MDTADRSRGIASQRGQPEEGSADQKRRVIRNRLIHVAGMEWTDLCIPLYENLGIVLA